jgi:hypothetical protein
VWELLNEMMKLPGKADLLAGHLDEIAAIIEGPTPDTMGDAFTVAALSALGGARDKAAAHVGVVLRKMGRVVCSFERRPLVSPVRVNQ